MLLGAKFQGKQTKPWHHSTLSCAETSSFLGIPCFWGCGQAGQPLVFILPACAFLSAPQPHSLTVHPSFLLLLLPALVSLLLGILLAGFLGRGVGFNFSQSQYLDPQLRAFSTAAVPQVWLCKLTGFAL